MTQLIKWPSIESFHNIRKATAKYPHILNGNHKVAYRGKVKLHGTNAAIQFLENDVAAQSRTTVLNVGHDNAGFAAFVERHKEAMLRAHPPLAGYTVFGEWVGPGINKGCAIHMVAMKYFVVFAALKRTSEDMEEKGKYEFVVEPEILLGMLNPHTENGLMNLVPNIHVLPWQTEKFVIDWNSSSESLEGVVKEINKVVDEVEACDPWVKETFKKEGTGEGLVYYPVSSEHLGRDNFSALGFKAKGEKHKIVKTKAPVVVDPAVAASVAEFVDLVVTEPRLEQGVQEACEGEYELRKIGPFIGWMCKDINKECQAELEASELKWKQVSKAVTQRVREWYIAKTEEL